MNKTLIEWVKNPDGSQGFTCNGKTGCLNGCPYCYARKLANGRLRQRYLANTNLITGAKGGVSKLTIYGRIAIEREGDFADPFYPRFWPTHLEQIRQRKKPAGIFLDDMSDWMGSYWPEEWTRQELQVMRDCPQHRFYTLTKQPQNLDKFSPFPENCWIGVTATDSRMAGEASRYLASIKAAVKFLSFEPLLDWTIVNSYVLEQLLQPLDWLIIGACTGTVETLLPLHHKTNLAMIKLDNKWTLQPQKAWVEEIVKVASKAGIPVFQKDNLKPLLGDNLRQELPE